LLGVIDARAAMAGMTRGRLVLCDGQTANVVGSRYLYKAILADRAKGAENGRSPGMTRQIIDCVQSVHDWCVALRLDASERLYELF
jgi:hypothetical protein